MAESLWQILRPDWMSLQEILPHSGGKALDVGSGSGRNHAIIEKAGYKWVGCDTADYPGVIKGDAHNLPFDRNIFDLVVIWQVMEYLDDPWQAIGEIFRVLKPGGMVIGSASFLEPMHGKVYFNFSQYGLEKILKTKGFKDILLLPGVGCFPLITWIWVRQLTGSEVLARCALQGARMCVWGISLIFDRMSAFMRILGSGYGSKSEWIRETAPYHFAGQIAFRASKREDL